MATPATQTQLSEDFEVSAKDFRTKLDKMCNEFQNLITLTNAVAELKKGEYLEYPDRTRLGKRELRSLQSQFSRELKNLAKYFTAAKKRKARKGKRPGTGFVIPIYVSDSLRTFFSQANLGSAYLSEQDGQGNVTWKEAGKLKDYLQLLTSQSITSPALLTPLFSIYAKVNNMQDPNNRQFLSATRDMHQYFGTTFQRLREQDLAKPKTTHVRRKDPSSGQTLTEEVSIPPFDPSRFRYANFQSIVSFNRVPKEELSENQKVFLQSDDVKQRLSDEQTLVSSTLSFYRQQSEVQRKSERAEKRKQKLSSK